ncbi:MAG: hypothetical protein LWX02_12220 [Deltaproteobacteria bacterium]|nr:hypothetical protein [Deltaproteobacteria bacterium]
MRAYLDELCLSSEAEKKARAQLATIEAQLLDEPNPKIIREAGRILQNITEGAIGSLLATAAQPGGASAVSDQDEFYMYLWLFLSRNSEKQHCSQPKSRSIASYWQQKRCWSETADAPQPGVWGAIQSLLTLL